MTTTSPRWIELEGTANTRDLGGLPVRSGGHVRPHVLVRSDNLQDLTPSDVQRLLHEIGVRTVLDLRTKTERHGTGLGPLDHEADVRVLHLSLIPDSKSVRADPGVVLPDRWADGATGAYLHYLNDAPEAIADAARVVATPGSGAAVVHCAAGKDRTGVVTALLLEAVGVPRDEVVADYALSNERIERIVTRLLGEQTYGDDARRIGLDAHRVDAHAMATVLDVLDEKWGGATDYLRGAGLEDLYLDALRDRLVER
ncbi:MAG: tyrosine-protein phosphatase [Mycobacteriales bacterium]